MTKRTNAERMRTAAVRLLAVALGAALLGLILTVLSPAIAAQGQRGGGRREAPRYSRPVGRARAPRYGGRPYGRGNPGAYQRPHQGQSANQGRAFQGQNRGFRLQTPAGGYGRGQGYGRQYATPPAAGYGRQGQTSPRPNYVSPGQNNGRSAYSGAQVRPALPGGRPYPSTFPPGHLGSWLNQHRNVPLQGQEQLLRSDPSFRQLPQGDQQRLMRQLRQVDQMPPQERERRLERAELIEHMSPQERMKLTQSSRELRQLPPGRQALVKRAFQQLSAVPLDQRQTVLDSQRYQGMFTPEERGILGSLLRAEPYEPAR